MGKPNRRGGGAELIFFFRYNHWHYNLVINGLDGGVKKAVVVPEKK